MVTWLQPHPSGALVLIYVQPGASTTELVGEHDGRLKLKIKAQPKDGEANGELIDFLSDLLGIPKKRIYLKKGESSRQKTILVELSSVEILSKIKC